MDEIKGTLPASPIPENPSKILSVAALAREQTQLRNRLERIYALTSDLICTAGFDGYFKDINPAFEKMLGFNRDELLAIPFINLVHPDDRAATLDTFTGLLEGGDTAGFENRYQCKDGSWKWVSWNANSDSGERLVYAVARDLTERRQAEEALQKSESKFMAIFQNAPMAIALSILPNGVLVDVNEAFEEIFGCKKEEAIGRTTSELGIAPDPQAREQLLTQFKQQGFVRHQELTYRNKTGIPIVISGNIDQVAIGEEKFILSTFENITERKRAEEALGRYAHRMGVINRLDHVISSSLDIGQVYDAFVVEMKDLVEFDRTSIVLLDDAGENWQIFRQWSNGKTAFQPSVWYPLKGSAHGWVFQNQRAYLESQLGEKVEWLEHKTLRADGLQSRVLFPLIVQGKVIGLLTLASRQADAYPASDVELLQTLADQLAIAVQNSRLYEQARLTAEERERRVQARTAQLEKSNKDLESFSYSVSHDLRAPLRAINGFAQILTRRHRALLDEEGRHYLDNVVEASTRMGILIDDLLQYSRIGRSSVHRQNVRLEELFAQILGDLASRITETHGEIHLPPPGSMGSLQSDATILGQIFTNIIDNALTYHRPDIPPVIRVTCQAEADHTLFGIADNGIGIPAEYLEKIFDVFQRLHTTEEYPGTGIGLAIVKKSAELLNGRVWAESTEGVGSTFWIQLPRE